MDLAILYSCSSKLETPISSVFPLVYHAPERKFYDRRRIHSGTELKKQNLQALVPPQKIRVSFRSTIPTLILHKGIVTPQIHRHRLATDRAMRNQFCRHTHILLLPHHLTNGSFVVVSPLAARLAALKQAILLLRHKKVTT